MLPPVRSLVLAATAAASLADTRGLWQRVVEFGVFSWLVAAAWTTSS